MQLISAAQQAGENVSQFTFLVFCVADHSFTNAAEILKYMQYQYPRTL